MLSVVAISHLFNIEESNTLSMSTIFYLDYFNSFSNLFVFDYICFTNGNYFDPSLATEHYYNNIQYVNCNQTKSGLLICNACLCGINTRCLVDTGASTNFIKFQFLNYIRKFIHLSVEETSTHKIS